MTKPITTPGKTPTVSPDLPPRPYAVLIAALGGEGGGVLSKWVVDAAENDNLWVQYTSIPGVSQRTGATTYYIELYPRTGAAAERRPVLALTANPGDVDMVVASEIVEAGRTMQSGYVDPERTTLIASLSRTYAIAEKVVPGDGRYDHARVLKAADQLARRAVIFDMHRLAKQTGSIINAVLLGVMAGSGEMPISRASFEDAIRRGGVAVEANLRGFAAGYDAATGATTPAAEADAETDKPETGPADLLARCEQDIPAAARTVAQEGVRRLVDYQDVAYARQFLDRLAPIVALDRDNGGEANDFRLTSETARYLALWMAYDDVIRVADLKTRASRFDRLRREIKADPDQPVTISEYLKPGPEEWASVLPRGIGEPLLRFVDRRGWTEKLRFGMRLRTSSISGFLALWTVSRLRGLRRRSVRFAMEQLDLEAWLDEVRAAAERDYDLGVEIAHCARLIKGYGETRERGLRNFRRILVVTGTMDDPARAAAAVAKLRAAALADPEGKRLAEEAETLMGGDEGARLAPSNYMAPGASRASRRPKAAARP